MEEFKVGVIIDQWFCDKDFIQYHVKYFLKNKINPVVSTNKPTYLEGFERILGEDITSYNNYIVFWDGKDESTKTILKDLATRKDVNVRVVRYDKYPIVGAFGVKWFFPRARYRNYDKSFTNWHHMQNWINGFKGDIVHTEYKLKSYERN